MLKGFEDKVIHHVGVRAGQAGNTRVIAIVEMAKWGESDTRPSIRNEFNQEAARA